MSSVVCFRSDVVWTGGPNLLPLLTTQVAPSTARNPEHDCDMGLNRILFSEEGARGGHPQPCHVMQSVARGANQRKAADPLR